MHWEATGDQQCNAGWRAELFCVLLAADDSLLLQSRDLGLTGSRVLLSLAQLLLTCLYFFCQSLHRARQDLARTTASSFFSYNAARY